MGVSDTYELDEDPNYPDTKLPELTVSWNFQRIHIIRLYYRSATVRTGPDLVVGATGNERGVTVGFSYAHPVCVSLEGDCAEASVGIPHLDGLVSAGRQHVITGRHPAHTGDVVVVSMQRLNTLVRIKVP